MSWSGTGIGLGRAWSPGAAVVSAIAAAFFSSCIPRLVCEKFIDVFTYLFLDLPSDWVRISLWFFSRVVGLARHFYCHSQEEEEESLLSERERGKDIQIRKWRRMQQLFYRKKWKPRHVGTPPPTVILVTRVWDITDWTPELSVHWSGPLIFPLSIVDFKAIH